ncbi:juxtaposed with another zinc finger protein 1a isoform X2 [Pimephales promelas]|uniref:juxtaposed with another zinc finger protein 1a isoform X2 n=1 Tax=Pimephales promelas TaxID=90988 RepID=UPI00195586D4|nr:juxtaposed with another zinc finger protein 1a isoform X2 [Pimephales promelas]
MTGVAAASFFSNVCRFGGCGLHFESLAELIVHIEDNHIDTDPRVLERQELQQPTYVALSYINRFMTEAARREQETQKKKVQPKIAISVTGGVSRNSTATPPRHSNGSLTPPVTPPITPSSSFRSSTPTGSECDEEEVEYEDSDSDESWTTESAISSESILSSMCMNGGDEKPFACPVPGCKKRYKRTVFYCLNWKDIDLRSQYSCQLSDKQTRKPEKLTSTHFVPEHSTHYQNG